MSMPGPKTAMRVLAFAVSLAALSIPAATGQQLKASAIPGLASANFGWQTNFEDWQDPGPGYGHGPMTNDPAYPFVNNSVVDNPENASVDNQDNYAIRNGTQPTVRIANSKDPILKPWAAAQVQATNEEILKGKRQVPFVAQSRCWPGGVPGQLIYPFEPMYFVQTLKEVWMIWQRDHMVRHVFLNVPHSANVKPSWFGESVGHYENGNTLVVDTIGLSANKLSYIDNFRTPHSTKEHVVERFTLGADGKSLSAIARVEDPDAYNAPITMMRTWFKANGPLSETVCAENNGDIFHQNLYPVPQAKTPDF